MYAKRTKDGVQIFLTPDDARHLVRKTCNCPREKADGHESCPLVVDVEDDQGKFTLEFDFDCYEKERQELKDHWRQVNDLLEGVYVDLCKLKPISTQWRDLLSEAQHYLDNEEFELALDALEDLVGEGNERLKKAKSLLDSLEEEEGEVEADVAALWHCVEVDDDE